MDIIISHLINILFYPVTSRTYFVILPCGVCFILALFALIRRIMEGKF